MLGSDTWTLLHTSTSSIQHRTHNGKDTTIYFTFGVSTKIGKRHLYHKDQDTMKQRKHWLVSRGNHDKKIGNSFYPKKLTGNACIISLILQCNGILSGPSTNWAEYFEEERLQPTSSSSWTPSSSWWTSSSWTSNWHQHYWKDSTWSEKW